MNLLPDEQPWKTSSDPSRGCSGRLHSNSPNKETSSDSCHNVCSVAVVWQCQVYRLPYGPSWCPCTGSAHLSFRIFMNMCTKNVSHLNRKLLAIMTLDDPRVFPNTALTALPPIHTWQAPMANRSFWTTRHLPLPEAASPVTPVDLAKFCYEVLTEICFRHGDVTFCLVPMINKHTVRSFAY